MQKANGAGISPLRTDYSRVGAQLAKLPQRSEMEVQNHNDEARHPSDRIAQSDKLFRIRNKMRDEIQIKLTDADITA